MKKLFLLLLVSSCIISSCDNGKKFSKLIEQELIYQNDGADIKYKSIDLTKEVLSKLEVKKMLADSLSSYNCAFGNKAGIGKDAFKSMLLTIEMYDYFFGGNRESAQVIDKLGSIDRSLKKDSTVKTYKTIHDYAYYQKYILDRNIRSEEGFVTSEYLSLILDRLSFFIRYENELKDRITADQIVLTKVVNRYKMYDNKTKSEKKIRTVCFFDKDEHIVYFESTPDNK